METNPTKTRRAIGIVRCSPDEKNDDKHSPEVQEQGMDGPNGRSGCPVHRVADADDLGRQPSTDQENLVVIRVAAGPRIRIIVGRSHGSPVL